MIIFSLKEISNLLRTFLRPVLRSLCGWVNGEVFLTWLRDVSIKEVESVKKPLVLFVDGHASHTALIETSDLCLLDNIVLYFLKSHASHIIQPIDLAFTGAVEVHWERQVRRDMQETREAVSSSFEDSMGGCSCP